MSMCDTCVHDGQCVDLPYCGGLRYQSVFAECDQCGRTINTEAGEFFEDDDDHCFCSLDCLDEYHADDPEGGAL